jgi:RND family efflux transporter MFP subunit
VKLSTTIVFLTLTGTAGVWLGLHWSNEPHKLTQQPPTASQTQAIPVSVAKIEEALFPEILIRPGEVVAARRFQLAPRVAGRLNNVAVRPGDRLDKGAALAELSAPELEQALQQAQSELRSARTELEDAEADVSRLHTLAKSRAVSEDSLRDSRVRRDRAQASVKVAEAVVSSRKADLSELTLRAPETLVVLDRLREPGDLSGPGLPVVEAESVKGHRFETWIPLTYVSSLQDGMAITIHVQGHPTPVEGRLRQVVPSADPVTRNCKVEIELPPNTGLLSGEYGDAQLVVGQSSKLTVPTSALQDRMGLKGAFVVISEATAQYRNVRTGGVQHDRVEVLAGLEQGEQVIVDPPGQLVDGAHIEIRVP